MPNVLSVEEFEYQTMLGSTNNSVVWGLGEVQWQPTFFVSPNIIISNSPFHPVRKGNSLYLHPRFELTINDDESEYKRTIENEIKEMITDGKSFWDLSTGNIEYLPPSSTVSVKIDDYDQVTIKVSTKDKNSKTVSTTMSLDSLTALLALGPMQSLMNQPIIMNQNPEVNIIRSIGNIIPEMQEGPPDI